MNARYGKRLIPPQTRRIRTLPRLALAATARRLSYPHPTLRYTNSVPARVTANAFVTRGSLRVTLIVRSNEAAL